MQREEKFKREGVTIIDWLDNSYNVIVHYQDIRANNVLIPRDWYDSGYDGDRNTDEYESLVKEGGVVETICEEWQSEPYGEQEGRKFLPSSLTSHRINGPAFVITELHTSKVVREEYFNNGYRHRPAHEGPAYIATSHLTDVVYEEDYFENDVLHNPYGPALIRRDAETGKTIIEDFHLKGERVPPFDVEASAAPGPKFDN